MLVTKGIDKCVLGNIPLRAVEWSKLISSKAIVSTEGITISIDELESKEDKTISYINIKDDVVFNRFTMGIKKDGGTIIPYCLLDLSIKALNGDNLTPLTVEGYRQLLNKVDIYLKDRYGIYLDFSNPKFKTMEVNMNIPLNKPFTDFKHLLTIFMALAPKTYKHRSLNFGEEVKFNAIYVQNKSIECKFYNKTEQLDKVCKIKLDKDIMRIEYKFLSSETIKEQIGTNSLNEMYNLSIYEFLKKRITKDFVKPTERHIMNTSRRILEIAKEEINNNTKTWLDVLIRRVISEKVNEELILLFDVEQLKDAVRKVSGKNTSRSIKRLESKIEDLHDYMGTIDNLKFIKNTIENNTLLEE